MATVALKQYEHYIGGEWVDAADGATFESVQPGHRRALVPGGPRQRRGHGPRRRGGARRRSTRRRWRGPHADAARPPAAPARRPDRRERRAARGRGVDRQRQADPRDARCSWPCCPSTTTTSRGLADKIHGDVIPALRTGDPQLHAARADRRGRRDHALELAAAADLDEARAGPRGGLHDRDQAVRAHVGVAARDDAADRAGRASRRASSTSSPASAPTPAQRWSTTRTSPRSPSPARARRPRASPRTAGERLAARHARAGRQVAAARVRRRRPAERGDGHRRRRLRRGRADLRRRARASSCTTASTTRCSSGCWSARGGSGSATRSTPRPSSGRWRSSEQLDKVESLRARSGATRTAPRCCTAAAGRRSPRQTGGWFHEPTVFTDVRNDMRVCQEEIFGPVAMFMRFRDEDEAVQLANDTRFGLAAGVWTRDLARAHRMAAASRRRHGLDQHLPRDVADVAARRLQASPASARRTAPR